MNAILQTCNHTIDIAYVEPKNERKSIDAETIGRFYIFFFFLNFEEQFLCVRARAHLLRD